MEVFVLYQEISDKYGTSKVIGVFSTKELAENNAPKQHRWHITKFVLDRPGTAEFC
ncbi:MAG: hypothetical protein J0I15_07245 [Herbaspirillum huttiense]|uniref:DUF7336 domain-containing protein n=1 Tax=Herbaspirillum huttiense TaxID=863372 RepID=UPI001AC82119|nr:hypothetical protein [Herbaspirillum huttiense]MBN9356225.1 hypothetical protein [Herbaspirillum huttiense]